MTDQKPPPYDNGFRFNEPVRETPGAMKARLFEHHKAANSLDAFYLQYPESRPKSRSRESGGRGR